ncbi:MAG: FMN-binding protein [Christensenellales bacterium]
MKKQLAAWLVLGLITVVAGFSLSVTNEVTKEPIQNQAVLAEAKAKQEVLPAAEAFEEVELPEDAGISLFAGKVGEETIGFVGKVTVNGYGGPIDVIAGIDNQGLVKGINVGGPSFSETAGLGAKSRETEFTSQFADKVSPIRVVKASDPKTDSSVDSITAATITSNAVVGGVNRIAKQVDAILNPQEEGPETTTAEGITYTASQQGFAGPVAVFVTVKEDGTITALKVGDDKFAETEGYGANALSDDFTGQFVGKALPLKAEDVEAISGASITTKAVIAAINQAYDEKKAVGPAAPAGVACSASKQGFAGPVAVNVTIDNATITALSIGDDQFSETEGYGAQALEPDFAKQFIGKSLPIAIGDIEVISGATFTSQAVIDAINDAFEQSKTGDSDNDTVEETEPVETAEPEVTPEPEAESADESDMKTASKQGFAGPVAVQVAFNEDGSIKALTVGDDAFAETPGLGAKAKDAEFTDQFVGKLPPLALRKTDEEVSASTIDGIASATVTSQAVVDAINEVFEQLKAVTDDTIEEEIEPVETAEPEVTPEAEPADESGMKTASKQGFAGPVAVQVAFNEDGSIKALTVGDDAFAETPGLGAKAKDAEFTDQFVGKLPPLALRKADEEASASTIDGITSATVTSQAVVDAVNEAAAAGIVEEDDAPSAEELKVYTAEAQGYSGPVAVEVSFTQDNKIAQIKIGDDRFNETPGLGAKALEEDFVSQFIGKSLPIAKEDIDAITAATMTTQAVIDAINLAYEAYQKEALPLADEGDAAMVVSKQGFAGPVAVQVIFNKDGSIKALTVGDDAFAETPGLGAKAKDAEFTDQFVGKLPPLALRKADEEEASASTIDGITSATVTSQAVVDAVNEAFEQLKK